MWIEDFEKLRLPRELYIELIANIEYRLLQQKLLPSTYRNNNMKLMRFILKRSEPLTQIPSRLKARKLFNGTRTISPAGEKKK